MSSSSSPSPERRIILPDRATRGRRLRAVVGEEEEEADEAFWGQAALAESEGDEGYSSQASSHSSGEDVPDSDFFDSENDIADDEDLARGEAEEADLRRIERGERQQQRKRLKPPERKKPARPPPAKKRARTHEGGEEGGRQLSPPAKAVAGGKDSDVQPRRRSSREAVRSRAKAKLDETQAKEKEEKKRARSLQRALERRAPVRLTQDELVAEAALTTILNEESLTQLLAKAERKRKALAARKAANPQPTIRYQSSRAGEYIHLLHCSELPAGWKQQPVGSGEGQAELCVITGLQAKYKPASLSPRVRHTRGFESVSTTNESCADACTGQQIPRELRAETPLWDLVVFREIPEPRSSHSPSLLGRKVGYSPDLSLFIGGDLKIEILGPKDE